MSTNNPVANYLGAGETVVSNLLLHHYHDLGMTTGELVVYLEFKSYADRGVLNPEVTLIADHLHTSAKRVFEQLQSLIHKKLCLQRTRQADGKEDVYYDFSPLLLKLAELAEKRDASQQQEQKNSQREDTFNKIEVEFGRPLSPMEMQVVNDWFDKDHYSAEVIDLALRAAVMNSARNWKYMDRILRNWQEHNLKSVDEIEQYEKQFEKSRLKRTANHPAAIKGPDIPVFKLNDLWKQKGKDAK